MKNLDILLDCYAEARRLGLYENINRAINIMMYRYPKFYEKNKAVLDLREDTTGVKTSRAIDHSKALVFNLRRCEFILGKKFRCEVCGSKNYVMRKKILATELPKYCSHACTKQSDEVRNKCKETVRAIYGTDNPSQSAAIRKKISENNYWSNLKRDDPSGYRAAIATREKLKKNIYGDNLELLNEKRNKTNIKNLGVPWPTMDAGVLKLRHDNHMAKYGVSNPSQRPEIQDKIAANKRTSNLKKITVYGKIFTNLQGYEPKALRYLVSKGVPVENVSKPKVSIPYDDGTGKIRSYHPDFVVKMKEGPSVMVEVKSTWTAGLTGDETTYYHKYSTLLKKSVAVEKAGYRFMLLIMNEKDSTPIYEKMGKLPAKLKMTS